MYLKTYGIKIMNSAFIGTKYESLMPLFTSPYYLVFSPDENVDKLLKISKKTPQLVLIGKFIINSEFLELN